MPKTEKVQKVEELKARIEASEALFLADFRGLTVTESGELRRSLSDAGTKFSVVKNTLMRLATAETDAADLQRLLEGPTAVAFVREDPVAAAKSLMDATRKFRTLVLKGAFVEGRVLTPEEAQSLATIEPRDVLLAKMAGLAKAEMARAAYGFKALQSRFLSLLQAFGEKLPGEAPPAEESAAQTEPAAAAEAAPEAAAAPEAEAPAEAEGGEGSTEAEPSAEAEAENQAEEADPVAEAGAEGSREQSSEEEGA
jgi:large subunit ribosomal protein L10